MRFALPKRGRAAHRMLADRVVCARAIGPELFARSCSSRRGRKRLRLQAEVCRGAKRRLHQLAAKRGRGEASDLLADRVLLGRRAWAEQFAGSSAIAVAGETETSPKLPRLTALHKKNNNTVQLMGGGAFEGLNECTAPTSPGAVRADKAPAMTACCRMH